MPRLITKPVFTLPLIAASALALCYSAHHANARPQSPPLTRSKLIGTWRVVSYKYGKMAHFAPWPKSRVMLKHMTPTGFVMVTYDARTGQVQRVAGGTYTVQGNSYQENIQYGLGADIKGLIGKPQRFTDEATATQWHHRGRISQGEQIEEFWTRVP